MIQGNTDVKGSGIIIRYYPSENKKNGEKVGNADITKDLIYIVKELINAGEDGDEVNDIRMKKTS